VQLAANLAPATIRHECARFGDGPFTYIVIDVLRASTVICTALTNGATEVIPFAEIDDARAAKDRPEFAGALLCGERLGRRIEGFDLGNSPAEYTPERVSGRPLIFASTNGSVALKAAPPQAAVLVGGLANLSRVAQRILELDQPAIIACAGKLGAFSLEDATAAGAVIARLWEIDPELELINDGAIAAQALWDRYKSDPAMALWQSRHGIYLIEIGFGSDLALCAAIDSAPVVPQMHNGRLTLP
jgi:2-phosphosulfolactate phosphatase